MTEQEKTKLLYKIKLLCEKAQEKLEAGAITYVGLAQLCAIEAECNEYLLKVVLHYQRKERKEAINHGSFNTYHNKMMIH